jgi:hypothetical protein
MNLIGGTEDRNISARINNFLGRNNNTNPAKRSIFRNVTP